MTTPENEPESGSDARRKTQEALAAQMAAAAEQIQKAKAALNRFAVLGAVAGGMKESKDAALAFAEVMRGVNQMTVSPELMKTVEEGVLTFGELARDLEDGE